MKYILLICLLMITGGCLGNNETCVDTVIYPSGDGGALDVSNGYIQTVQGDKLVISLDILRHNPLKQNHRYIVKLCDTSKYQVIKEVYTEV